jgi:hypothetical protein
MPTAWISGKFCFTSSSPTMQLNGAPNRVANACAACASSSGPISFDGVLIRSRASAAASAIRAISATSMPSGGTSRTSGVSFLR